MAEEASPGGVDTGKKVTRTSDHADRLIGQIRGKNILE